MHPSRFGPGGQPLFGAFHKPVVRKSPVHAVLLCNPFGQEAVRIHRFFKVLADRLSREGIACLRFDYFGTGDSLGDDEDGDLERWVQDIVNANELLRQRSMTQEITWVAPRLAAPLAARASRIATPPPRQIVFWDPVVDGQRYLDDLDASHRSALSNLPSPEQGHGEAELFGFGVGASMLAQVAAINRTVFDDLRATRAPVLTQGRPVGGSSPLSEQLIGQGIDSPAHALSIDFDWTSEEALNTALVPAEGLQMLTALVKGPLNE